MLLDMNHCSSVVRVPALGGKNIFVPHQ